jgi:sulfatase maturation enzyme AslB (radical SAM superfamily)
MKFKKIKHYYRRFREIGLDGSAIKLAYRIRNVLEGTPYPKGFPTSLHIEISNICNLRCQYCMLNTNLAEKEIMNMETIELFAPYIKYMRSISLSGLAEPLLNKNLVNILKWIKHLSPVCRLSANFLVPQQPVPTPGWYQ